MAFAVLRERPRLEGPERIVQLHLIRFHTFRRPGIELGRWRLLGETCRKNIVV